MGFSYHISDEEQCRVFALGGRFLEKGTGSDLISEIANSLDNHPKDVVVDLETLEYMNSTGIKIIVKMIHLVSGHNRKIVFVSVPERVQELLKVVKLNAMLEIKRNKKEGITYLNNN